VFAIAFGRCKYLLVPKTGVATHGTCSGADADSTASTTQSFCHLVLSSEPIHKKLVAEILDTEKYGHLPKIITYFEVQNLPYFQACLKETMRLRPAVGLDIIRYMRPDGAYIDGVFYQGGTRVATNGWVLHRDQATFSKDAQIFRPERWWKAMRRRWRDICTRSVAHFPQP
jgi:cytochrome P450